MTEKHKKDIRRKLKVLNDVGDSGILTTQESSDLKANYETMNPFDLKKELEKQLKWFFRIAEAGKQEAA